MWIYLSLLLVPAAAALASALRPRRRGAVFIATAVALTLFIGLRREVGCDWNNYLLMFRRAKALPLPEALAFNDPGYMFLNRLIASAHLPMAWVNVAAAAVFVGGVIGFARLQPRPWLALVVATPVLMAIVALAPTRQSMATGLILFGVCCFWNGRRGWAAALLLLAPTVQWGAAVILPLIPLMYLRRVPATATIAATGLGFGVALTALVLAVPALATHAEGLSDANGAWFRQVLALIALAGLPLLIRRRLLNGEEMTAAAVFAAVALFSIAIGAVSTMAMDRVGYYAIPLQMIVLSRAPDLVAGRHRALAACACATPFVVLFLGWLHMTSQKACMAPYETYLAEPGALLPGASPDGMWLKRGLGDHYPPE